MLKVRAFKILYRKLLLQVHPDLHTANPLIQQQNTDSLQLFNNHFSETISKKGIVLTLTTLSKKNVTRYKLEGKSPFGWTKALRTLMVHLELEEAAVVEEKDEEIGVNEKFGIMFVQRLKEIDKSINSNKL